MSLINTQIKPFSATAYQNGKFIDITQDTLKGKWSAFVFYPADFTFVCPTELGDLADHYAEFQKIGVEIYGVSTDTHFTHKGWADASDTIRKIKYPMIGDPTGAITRNFDVMIEEAGLALRGTFVIDPEGKIRMAKSSNSASAATRRNCCARSGCPVRGVAPGRSLPCQVDAGRQTLTPSLDLVGKI
jgi:peroxiredoxin